MIDEMAESQASATEIGVTKVMSQLNCSHTQGVDDLNFGDEEETAAVMTEEEVRQLWRRKDVALCHAWDECVA
jgi:hypothetical protein